MHSIEPEQPDSASDIGPRCEELPLTLLFMTDARRRAQTHALLTRNGYRCVVAQDKAAALDHVRLSLSIGAVIADAGAMAQSEEGIVSTLRQHCLRPLAAILLVPASSYAALCSIAQPGPGDILPDSPDDEQLLAATRAALGWYRRSVNMRGISQELLRMQAQAEAQLTRLMRTAARPGCFVRAAGGRSLDRDTVKALMRAQSALSKLLGYSLIDDAAFVMLLDLSLMHLEAKPLAVTALCVSSGVPVTTALRRLDQLIAKGLALKTPDPADRRRLLVSITPKGMDCVSAIAEHIQGELKAVVAA